MGKRTFHDGTNHQTLINVNSVLQQPLCTQNRAEALLTEKGQAREGTRNLVNTFKFDLQGECSEEQLTNVFRSEIDLNAHITSRHVNELGKAQQKQMRQIQPNFTSSRY